MIAVTFEAAERRRAEDEADRERERAEQLLLNILPVTVAQRLRRGEGLIADHYTEATVLFADIVDFTRLSANIAPEAVVSYLNVIFSNSISSHTILGWRKSRRSEMPTWLSAECPLRGGITPRQSSKWLSRCGKPLRG